MPSKLSLSSEQEFDASHYPKLAVPGLIETHGVAWWGYVTAGLVLSPDVPMPLPLII